MSRRAAHDKRLVFIVFFSFLCLAAIGVRLLFLQVIDAGRYQKLALQQRSDHIQVSSKRGTILDRDGEIMAVSEDAKTIYATPYLVKNPKKVARKIFEVLGEDEEEVLKKLTSDSGFAYIVRKADPSLVRKIEKCEFEGIGFIDESRRFYPLGKSAAQAVGIVDIDNKGQSGIELFYEDLLGGKPGKVFLEKDASGKPIPGTVKTEVAPVEGTDIQLTLDAEIQKYTAEVMEEGLSNYSAKSATALVMECNTGNVLAMATAPSFDPHSREDLKPECMRSRAITDVYEPGSALKIVTASAALSEGIVNSNTPIGVPPQLKVADKVFTEATP
ncbi:MAG: penicillin-binding transpeptidase domain-containing protein, partial [Actinomycetota bacterium]|nr:penicillin-binding transpeptidase domain-containing protein [Actinomycetota bacterium]